MEIFNPRLVSSDLFVDATNDRRGRGGASFLRKVKPWYGRSLFKLKNLRFEDQIEPFPHSFQGLTIGKICSASGSLKTHVGLFLYVSLPYIPRYRIVQLQMGSRDVRAHDLFKLTKIFLAIKSQVFGQH